MFKYPCHCQVHLSAQAGISHFITISRSDVRPTQPIQGALRITHLVLEADHSSPSTEEVRLECNEIYFHTPLIHVYCMVLRQKENFIPLSLSSFLLLILRAFNEAFSNGLGL
jgi:hypothetical protein